MLFVHEVHRVVGTKEDEFEAAFRDGWMPTLAKDDDARLLWYMNHAHGSGVSYNVVTITAVRDGAAWERLARRLQQGDLQDWARETDTYRHDVTGKTMLPVYWSAIQEVDFDAGSDRRRRARAVALHGRHGLAVLVTRRLHQVLGRALLPADPALGREAPGPSPSTSRRVSRTRTAPASGAKRCSGRRSVTRQPCCTCSRPTSRRRCVNRAPICTTP